MVDVNIDTALVDAINDTELIGSRVYPLRFPQNATFPCATYARISTRFEDAIDGTLVASDPRFQIDVWTRSYSEARQAAAQVKDAILAFTGGAVTLYARGLENERDAYDPDTGLFHPQLDVTLLHGN
jgi:hypothetical protein